MSRNLLLAIAVPTLFVVTGCSGAGSAEDPTTSADAIGAESINLKDYSLTTGIVATGADAQKLYQAMKKSGGAKDIGEGVLLGGLTGEQLGMTDPDDKDESFGLSCTPKAADHTFSADTCAVTAIVKSQGQTKKSEGAYDIELTGKLAKAVAHALPTTSPEGLVGAMTTGSGKISCKTGPGPVASSCKLPIAGVMMTLQEAVDDTSGDSPMSAADAKKLVKAFF